MEEKIIINLQKFGNEVLDVIFQAESYIASWIGALFLFLVIIIFINKKFGFVFGCGFLISLGFNYILKLVVNRPRPYIANSQIINKLQTIGSSFPSGHVLSATFMVLVIWHLFYNLNKIGKFKLYNKLWFRIVSSSIGVLFIILTIISRMYLGQHYLTDCLMGSVVGILGFVFTKYFYNKFCNQQK